MRNSMNIILVNLSVADLLFLLVGTTTKFVNVIYSPVVGDSFFCQCFLTIPLVNVATFASLLFVSLISVERYIAVCKPHQYLQYTCHRLTLAYVTCVWISSFALTICLLPSTMDFVSVCIIWPSTSAYANFPAKVGLCEAISDFWSSVNECVQIFPFFISLLLNILCFVKIMSRLYAGRVLLSFTARQTAQQDSQVKRRHKHSTHAATRMLIINGVAFFVLATPFHVTSAIQFFENYLSEWSCGCRELKDISVLLLYVNSAVNPFIYGMTNRTYRKAYYSVFSRSQHSSGASWNTVATTDDQNNRRITNV
ncbi:G-protein coupled receptor 39 [Holothuria leucospilota]|uniref:G-protein coupled receptor 39 n=1 Tax=Holothuria leucospilota TaxID=206669 RepID=A0A9Q1H669_HOLLE|nr:G-protein coupled receptor 39 [Holothuria leucospilota]